MVRPVRINAKAPLDVSIGPEIYNHVIPESTTTKWIILQKIVLNVLISYYCTVVFENFN